MNRTTRVVSLAVMAAMLASILLTGCGATPTAAPEPTKAPPAATKAPAGPTRGGTFTNVSFADAVSLQPLLTQDNASSNYQALMWAALTRLDPKTLDVIGNLYEDKPVFSADGSTMTWKLRKGLKWSDGTPITSADVLFTWQKMMDPKVNFPYRQTYQTAFSDLTAPDESTVVYKMAKPGYCPAISNASLVNGIIPKSVYGTLDINQNDINNKPAVVSGIWKFKEWQKDDHFTASPSYDGFVRGQAYLDSYIYRIVKDNTVNTQLFKTQEVDVATPDPVDWDEVSKLPFAQPVRYVSAIGASWTYIGMNLRIAPLDDKVVRQAIATAVNQKELIDKVRLGFAKPQFSILPTSSWAMAAESDLPKFAFDPAKAKKMLDDAGYKVGANGIRIGKDGKPMKLRIFYNAGNKQREQISIITQQYLKDIGIDSEVIAEEWNAYLDRVNKTRDMDLYVLGWVGGWDPNSTGNIWKSDGGQNSTGYANKDVDKWFDDAANVPGCAQADRKTIYVKIQKQIAEDAPYVFLYTNENLEVYNKRINVNALTGLGVNYQLELWSVNPAAAK